MNKPDSNNPIDSDAHVAGGNGKNWNSDGGQRSMTDENKDPRVAESVEEQLDHAAEELITGDSDDPPLAEDAVVEMLKMTHTRKGSGF
jgi:hypothetical protein